MTPPSAAAKAQDLIARAKQAMALHSQGDATAAEQHYAAVAPHVQHPGLYVGYATLLTQAERPSAAAWRQRALAFYPDNPGAVELAGAAALATGDNREAAKWLRRRLCLGGGDFASSYDSLGVALTRAGDAAEGARHCREAVRLYPANAERRFNLAAALEAAGCLNDARSAYRRALALRPDHPGALENCATAAVLAGDARDANGLYRKLTTLFPHRPEFRFLLGETRLALGEWSAGWADMEARRRSATLAPPRPQPEPPPWNGEPLHGGELLIVAEQGVGDVLLFSRLIPLAAERAGRAVLAVHDSLLRLLRHQWPERQNDETLTIRPLTATLRPGRETAAWVPLGSLPGLLAPDAEHLPAPPYITADPDLTTTWRLQLNRGRGVDDNRRSFGLVWAGNPEYPHDRWRSPGLAAFAPLLDISGWRPVALQVGPGRKDLAATPWPAGGVDQGGEVRDFADTAAIIANLDLVISSVTSVLHLAAAMGMKTWGAVPAQADWRWRRDATGNHLWYPWLRLFRQREPGRWDDVAADLRAALEQAAG